MASVTVQKWTTAGACGGQIRHIYREAGAYKNVDIQKDGQTWMLGTGDDCRAAIRQTIAEIDAQKPPKRLKKDRKTVAELCIPAPREGMDEDTCLRFFAAVCDELEKAYHVCGGAVHADEVHDYIDPGDGKVHTSRLHFHALVVPETGDKGLNMKSWLTKARYRELNALCDRVCRRELGHPYQDGSKSRSRGTVERLKEKSATEAARQLPELQAAVRAAQADREAAEKAAAIAKDDKKRQEAAKAALERQTRESQQAAAKAAQEARESRQAADAAIAKSDKKRQEAAKIERESADRIQAAAQDIKRAFPAAGKKEDYLEEREVKTGLLQRETVTVARNPAAIMTAVEKAQAAAMGLREMDAIRQDNAALRDRLRDATAELVELRTKQERLQVLDAVAQAWDDPYIREQLDDRRIGMSVDDVALTPAQAVQALRMLDKLDKLDAKAQDYDRIMQAARQRPELRTALEKTGLIKKQIHQRDRGLTR